MEAQGYKAGQGLGTQLQGITAPLGGGTQHKRAGLGFNAAAAIAAADWTLRPDTDAFVNEGLAWEVEDPDTGAMGAAVPEGPDADTLTYAWQHEQTPCLPMDVRNSKVLQSEVFLELKGLRRHAAQALAGRSSGATCGGICQHHGAGMHASPPVLGFQTFSQDSFSGSARSRLIQLQLISTCQLQRRIGLQGRARRRAPRVTCGAASGSSPRSMCSSASACPPSLSAPRPLTSPPSSSRPPSPPRRAPPCAASPGTTAARSTTCWRRTRRHSTRCCSSAPLRTTRPRHPWARRPRCAALCTR